MQPQRLDYGTFPRHTDWKVSITLYADVLSRTSFAAAKSYAEFAAMQQQAGKARKKKSQKKKQQKPQQQQQQHAN